jgi:hypothetical protein
VQNENTTEPHPRLGGGGAGVGTVEGARRVTEGGEELELRGLREQRRGLALQLPGPETAVFGCSAPCTPIQKRHTTTDSLGETLRTPNRPGKARTVSSTASTAGGRTCGGKGVRLARNIQVGPCIPVRIQL